MQNTGLLSHGVTNPDLGFCCHRNSLILRELTGVEHYRSRPTPLQGSARPPAACWRIARTGAPPATHAAATELMPMMGGHRAATV